MQENDVSKICVGFLIISIFAPSKLFLSLMHQLHDFALKSPNTTTKNEIKVVFLSKFNSRFYINKLSSS